MLIRVPDYYEDFRCLAGACPHSCCTQWEVVIDEATAARYRAVPGPLGEKLRRALQRDAEGDLCFPLNGGRCPFLDEENLCEIHKQLGQEVTSITCREHPRFTEDYGTFKEITLAASCPAANDLLLGSEAHLHFVEFRTEEPEEACDEWIAYLLPLRRRMLTLLADRALPLSLRMQRFLLLAEAAQACLDEDRPEALPGLPLPASCPGAEADAPALFPAALRVLTELETLEPDFPALLEQAVSVPPTPVSEALAERIAVYFAFRYLLKAVNDGDLLGRAQWVVYAVLVIRRLAAVCGLGEALRRFSCEIEHSEENLDALLDALRWEESLSPAALLQALEE